MFRKCLYWHARWLALVVRRFQPDFFATDFRFIQRLGVAVGSQDAEAAVLNFRKMRFRGPSFWRIRLRIRVSSRKASKLAQDLFGAEG